MTSTDKLPRKITADDVFAVLPYRNREGLRRVDILIKLGLDPESVAARRCVSQRLYTLRDAKRATCSGVTRNSVWNRA